MLLYPRATGKSYQVPVLRTEEEEPVNRDQKNAGRGLIPTLHEVLY